MNNIHPTAIINKNAKIADNVTISPYVVIGDDVEIGEGTYVGPFCVFENCTVGKNNEFVANSFIGVKPQDLSYKGEHTRVVMGDRNKVREGVTVHRSTDLNVPTKIGNDCLLMAQSHVAHDVQIGDGVILVNSAGVAGHIIIEDRAIISGLCGLHQFVRVGTFAMLSGMSGLPQDLPPYCIASGARGKLVGLNIIGLKRAGFKLDTIRSLKNTYKILFMEDLNMSDAIIEARKQDNLTPEAKHMIDFCAESKRGVITARMKSSDENEEE